MSLRMIRVGGCMASDPSQLPKSVCRVRPKGTFSWTAQEGEQSEDGASILSTHSLQRDKSQISVFNFLEGAKSSRLTQMTSSLALSRAPLMPDRAACFLSCVMRDAWLSRVLRPRAR